MLGSAVTPLSPADLAQLGVTTEAFRTESGTTIIHDVTQGQLVNLLLNTDSNRDFRMETDVTLVLPGFESVQAGMADSLFALRLADDIGISSISAMQ